MRAGLLLLIACSGPPLPEPFVVSDLRLIGMVAQPAEVKAGEPTHVTAYFFDPDSDSRSVRVQFYQCEERGADEGTAQCKIDGSPLTVLAEVDAQRVAADLWTADLDFTPAAALLSDKGAIPQRYGYQEVVSVRGDNGLRVTDGFKRLTVKPSMTQVFNQNPVLNGFDMQVNGVSIGSDLGVDAVERGTVYTFVPTFDPSSIEAYVVTDFAGAQQMLIEEMSFTWSCSPACGVSQRISYQGDLVTVTTPDQGVDSGRFSVQLVMRDGRGGEAVHVRSFALLPKTKVL